MRILINIIMFRRICASIIFATLVLSPLTIAESPPITAEEVRILREQVETLSRRLEEVEAELQRQQSAVPPDTAHDKVVESPPAHDRVRIDERGVFLQSSDELFQLRIRTRLGFEFGWFAQDRELKRFVGDEQDGVNFRYARLDLTGRFTEDFRYRFEIDFAGEGSSNSPSFRDVWFEYTALPGLFDSDMALRIGHFKEPISFEEIVGTYDRPFVENSLLRTFVPSRNTGIMVHGAFLGEPGRELMSWAAGLFKETGSIPSRADSDEDQGWQLTARLTALPYYASEGRRLIHLGAAYSHRTPRGALVRFGARPEASLSRFRYIDTEGLPELFRLSDARVDEVCLLGLEAATVWGPLSVQSEALLADVRTDFAGSLDFSSWYLMASYFLTGEHRPYNHRSGVFGLPRVARPFSVKGERRGWGAWELTARHSHIDLSSGPIRAGEQSATTVGVNWYLNRNLRSMLNYTYNRIDHPLYDGRMESLTLRFNLDF